MDEPIHSQPPDFSTVSGYVTYALSTLSVILLNIPVLSGVLSLLISTLTILKLGWDLYDKWQTKRKKAA